MNQDAQHAPLALVLGASGFLGSHVILELVSRGYQVRALARPDSDISTVSALPIEHVHGDVLDRASLDRAMINVDVVYHCVVNAKAWLRDVSQLYRVNVDGLRNTLDSARAAGVKRFVMTSTIATIAPNPDGLSGETDHYTSTDGLPNYYRCRIEAENLFFEHTRDGVMEGVAACVGTTFGRNDRLPTPQGQMALDASRGRLPFYWAGGSDAVCVQDAACGMVAAGEHGRAGERYLLTERWMTYRELIEFSARYGGRRLKPVRFPTGMLHLSAIVTEWFAARLGLENRFNMESLRCSTAPPPCDSSKAKRELNWHPRCVWDAVSEAIEDLSGATR